MCCGKTEVETTFILGIICSVLNFAGCFGGPFGELEDLKFLYSNVAISLVGTLFGKISFTIFFICLCLKLSINQACSHVFERGGAL